MLECGFGFCLECVDLRRKKDHKDIGTKKYRYLFDPKKGIVITTNIVIKSKNLIANVVCDCFDTRVKTSLINKYNNKNNLLQAFNDTYYFNL